MKKMIDENGSVSIFVIVAFLFCMTILVSMYWANTNYQIMAIQAEQRIRETYEEDVTSEDLIHAAIQERLQEEENQIL